MQKSSNSSSVLLSRRSTTHEALTKRFPISPRLSKVRHVPFASEAIKLFSSNFFALKNLSPPPKYHIRRCRRLQTPVSFQFRAVLHLTKPSPPNFPFRLACPYPPSWPGSSTFLPKHPNSPHSSSVDLSEPSTASKQSLPSSLLFVVKTSNISLEYLLSEQFEASQHLSLYLALAPQTARTAPLRIISAQPAIQVQWRRTYHSNRTARNVQKFSELARKSKKKEGESLQFHEKANEQILLVKFTEITNAKSVSEWQTPSSFSLRTLRALKILQCKLK